MTKNIVRWGECNKIFALLQIIIEAVSGQTRLSDIAFDDVSLFFDSDCEEDDTKVQDDVIDDDAVFSVGSCENRCYETKNTSVLLDSNHTLSCSCSEDCELRISSCCPDFIGLCSTFYL